MELHSQMNPKSIKLVPLHAFFKFQIHETCSMLNSEYWNLCFSMQEVECTKIPDEHERQSARLVEAETVCLAPS